MKDSEYADTWKQYNIFGSVDILSADGTILIHNYDDTELSENIEDEGNSPDKE